ncbi:peptide chain release factor N(5)-glutamine methyltransferase [Terriglobus aquaticus]|uniref:Release factor glutamine methyltransferase n=1 Tax=Terriglobus aquaticus TaxID=940139 RepID=A0ABW9KHB9_9BACT|nr:peptide chain release factor N(5)-glutamine methyltransferase [Terriglobus aquaticus]
MNPEATESTSSGPAATPGRMTLREAELWAEQQLRIREDLRDRARLDASQLVEIATGTSRVARLAHPEAALTSAQQERLSELVQRRLKAEPMQHLRGSQEFYGRDFRVTPDVLIPRPETEDIVTAVLESVPDRNAALRIADVGTGSGALAVTLALELPGSQVTALDISREALLVAQRNAERLGAAGRIRFLESDLFANLRDDACFDVIVSNPPYIPLPDAPTLHAEVREFEPSLALFAGHDGMDVYRRLIPEAHARLCPGGLLLMETGGEVTWILEALRKGFHAVQVRPDLQGIARVVSARRH